MQLYYQTFPEGEDVDGSGDVPIVIIPGLFGSTTNWRSFARQLSSLRPVIVIDQRNHGRSPHSTSHNYNDMVSDLLEMIDYWGHDEVILCGHSMGGKVAMLFSVAHPERVEKLIVLDIAPKTYKHSHAPFLEALLSVDVSTLKSRAEADKALKSAIPDTGTRLFLLQSLTGSAGAYHWRINLEVLHSAMSEITGFPALQSTLEPIDLETHVIFGEASDYVLAADHDSFRELFANPVFKGIPDAGHWLHVEQSKAVLAAILEAI